MTKRRVAWPPASRPASQPFWTFGLLAVLMVAACAEPARQGPPVVATLEPPAAAPSAPTVQPAAAPAAPEVRRPREPADGAAADGLSEDLRCLALAIYWEARSEDREGQRAVAHVVFNRVADATFPDTVCGVVKQDSASGCQFSWWCDGLSDQPEDGEAWAEAQDVAREAMAAGTPDPTDGATYFHRRSLTPDWRDSLRHTATIGPHLFYRSSD